MNRLVGYVLITIALLTLVVWAVSMFIQPILPSIFNNGLVLFFVALLAVIGVLAQFKDVIELFQYFSKRSDNSPTNKIENIKLGNQFLSKSGNVSLYIKVYDFDEQIIEKFKVNTQATFSLFEIQKRIKKKKPNLFTEADYASYVIQDDGTLLSGSLITNGATIIFRPVSGEVNKKAIIS
jgi:hypothetical protein